MALAAETLKNDARDVRRLDRLMMRSREWSEAPEDGKRAYLATGAERETFRRTRQEAPRLAVAARPRVRRSVGPDRHQAELDAKQAEVEERRREREQEQARRLVDAPTRRCAGRPLVCGRRRRIWLLRSIGKDVRGSEHRRGGQ